nr:uncharacterized protein LOC105318806 [Crassostrea gigas]
MDQYFRMFMFLFLCIFINYIQSNELYLNEFVSNKTMNWTEAVQYCRTRNSILVSSPTQTDHEWNHWTRKQWRISPWIHVIGCFNETQIDPSQTVNNTLTSPSVVTCQQECSTAHYTFFGLKNTSCVCLSDPFSVTEAIDPRLCNTSCSTSEILNDCGGPGTYSVYQAGDLISFDEYDLNATYMALKCSKTAWTFVFLQSSTLTVNCQCRRPGTELIDTVYSNWNWKDCYKNCKREGQYLHGDYDVLDPVSACQGIQAGNVYTWVGIARQNFISFSSDLSYSLQRQCETCRQSNCSLTSCSECDTCRQSNCSLTSCSDRYHAVCKQVNLTH